MTCGALKVTALLAIVAVSAACGSGTTKLTATTDSASPPGVSAQDRKWLVATHQANIAEVEAGELAKAKGAAAAVRSAGAMLVTDHTRMDVDLVRVARAVGVRLPLGVAPQDAVAASRLRNESGSTFDHDFVATMLTGHQKAIADTQAEIRLGSAPQVTGLARTSLPVLRKHLATLQKAAPSA